MLNFPLGTSTPMYESLAATPRRNSLPLRDIVSAQCEPRRLAKLRGVGSTSKQHTRQAAEWPKDTPAGNHNAWEGHRRISQRDALGTLLSFMIQFRPPISSTFRRRTCPDDHVCLLLCHISPSWLHCPKQPVRSTSHHGAAAPPSIQSSSVFESRTVQSPASIVLNTPTTSSSLGSSPPETCLICQRRPRPSSHPP